MNCRILKYPLNLRCGGALLVPLPIAIGIGGQGWVVKNHYIIKTIFPPHDIKQLTVNVFSFSAMIPQCYLSSTF